MTMKFLETAGNLTLSVLSYIIQRLNFEREIQRKFKGRDDAGIGGTEALFGQCDRQGISILAVQETRLQRQVSQANPYYFTISSPADQNGCGGMILGLSKKHPHAFDSDGNPLYFRDDDVSIVEVSNQRIFAKIVNRLLRIFIVAVHSPHNGYEDEYLRSYWHKLGEKIMDSSKGFDLICVRDYNAKLGQYSQQGVGNHQGETPSKATDFVLNFISRLSLWVPATFEAYQQGPGSTWYHSSGLSSSRLDYIMFPYVLGRHASENICEP